MTDKQDIHAEPMELADDYAKSTHNDGFHGLSGVSLITEGAAGRHAAFARTLTDRLTQAEQEIVALTLSVSNRDARIAELEAQLEAERLRLAACGVAALMNTRDSTKDRIGKDNPFHSGSYSDVCRAVDREIEYREQLEALRQAIEAAQPSPAAMEPMAYPPMPAPVVHWPNPLPLVGGGVVQAATYYSADQMRAYVAADRALRPQTLQQERQPMDPKEAYHLLVEWTNEDGDWLALLRKVEKHHGITAQQGGE